MLPDAEKPEDLAAAAAAAAASAAAGVDAAAAAAADAGKLNLSTIDFRTRYSWPLMRSGRKWINNQKILRTFNYEG